MSCMRGIHGAGADGSAFVHSVPVAVWLTMHCAHCGWQVTEGPHGGYVCPQCFYTVEPDNYRPTVPSDVDGA